MISPTISSANATPTAYSHSFRPVADQAAPKARINPTPMATIMSSFSKSQDMGGGQRSEVGGQRSAGECGVRSAECGVAEGAVPVVRLRQKMIQAMVVIAARPKN